MSGSPLPGQTLSTHHRMLKYDAIVRALNASRSSASSSSSSYLLLKNYAASLSSAANSAASSSSDKSSAFLAGAFILLSRIVREGQPGVGERSCAAAYLGQNGEGEAGRQIRRQIVDGGKTYLEEQ